MTLPNVHYIDVDYSRFPGLEFTGCNNQVRNIIIPPQTLFVVGILFSRCLCVPASVCACVRPSVTFFF